MIHIDNLDGEGTIFITTDYDGTKSIGHVEEEYVDIMQEVLKEVKRLREELRLTKEWLDQLYDEDLVSAFRFHVYGDEEE